MIEKYKKIPYIIRSWWLFLIFVWLYPIISSFWFYTYNLFSTSNNTENKTIILDNWNSWSNLTLNIKNTESSQIADIKNTMNLFVNIIALISLWLFFVHILFYIYNKILNKKTHQ